ncbi:acetyl-CoA synthetase-like protein [Auriscalpium vulgare]|uniref:Acetyl-CoA synthetase-like protein n=1 Tax=Auriscalpium vulgare TaxID=40419 RepID=A0ACB8RPQ2_9AGAM|nr:acetyl-CoA synthetase-like protein [Auriscalpium vulgare]
MQRSSSLTIDKFTTVHSIAASSQTMTVSLPRTQVLKSSTFHAPPLEDTSLTIPELYDWQYEHSPRHPFFHYEDAPGQMRTILWAEAVRAIHNGARFIASRVHSDVAAAALDGRPTVIGALAATDTLTYVTTELGIMRAGLTVFPISPRNSPEAIAHLLKTTGTAYLLVSGEKMMQDLAQAALEVLRRDEGAREPELSAMPRFEDLYTEDVFSGDLRPYPSVKFDLETNILILHSSGSTAFPKPIPWSHPAFRALCGVPWRGELDLCGLIMSCHAMPVFHGMGIIQICIVVSSGVEMAVFKPAFPAVMPNPQNVLEASIVSKSDIVAGAPAFLEAWSKNPDAMRYLRSTKAVVWGGGPLPKEIGDYLISEGVEIHPQYGSSECGVINKFIPLKALGSDWEYFTISPHCLPVLLPQDDGSFELVLVDHEAHHPVVLNTKVDGRDAYATSDLLVPHPTRQGLWKIYGRKDDQIMLSIGEKTNPGPLEGILNQDRHVMAAVMFGRGKPQNGVIIDPKPQYAFDPQDEQKLIEFRNAIWPTVEKMNEYAPQHSRLFKEMLLVATPSKGFVYTAKMTARRQAILKDYAPEIEALYRNITETAQTDIPVPLKWSQLETLHFVREAVHHVMRRNVADDVDVFQHGCDSLQATYIRNSVLRALRETSPKVAKGISSTFVYDRPTIIQMAAHLHKAAVDPNADHTSVLATRGQELQAIVNKYTTAFPTRSISATPNHRHSGKVYLVTGTTGGLGANLLAQLLASPSVSRVYAFNRPSKSASLAERHADAFSRRGLDEGLLLSHKLVNLEGDLSRPSFGLDPSTYTELQGTVTHIIHNAWRINLNISLLSFEDSIVGVRRLVDFALSSPLADSPRLLFVSSIGVFINFDNRGAVEEEELRNPEIAVGKGYTESKWISERILDAAAERTEVKPVIVRLGQVCGETNGVWNQTEWFPAMVKSAATLKCLPNLDGTVSWITAPDAASAIIEMSKSDADSPRTLHLVHPRGVPFSSLISPLSSALGVPLVPYNQWLAALERSSPSADAPIAEVEHTQRENPAIALLDFFRSARVGPHWEPLGVARLSTDRAVLVSDTLRVRAEPLGEQNARQWLRAWQASGFLAAPVRLY